MTRQASSYIGRCAMLFYNKSETRTKNITTTSVVLLGVALVLFGILASGCTNTNKNTNEGNLNTVSVFHYNLKIDNTSPIYQEIHNATGLDIVGIYSPVSMWSEKLNTMALANDLPDIFITYGPGFSDGENLRQKGALLNLAPYINPPRKASLYPNLQKHLEIFNIDYHQAGEIFFIPINVGLEHTFIFRQDMLDAIGVKKPETLDELYIAAKKLRQKYNIYPITSGDYNSGGLRRLNPIFYAHNGSWYSWYENPDTGLMEPDWISNNNKEAVRYIRKLYNEQLLDPNFFTNTDATKNKKIYASEAAIAQVSNYGRIHANLLKESPEARLSYSPVLFDNNKKKAGIQRMPFLTAISIPANRNDRQIHNALALLDYLYSHEGLKLLRYGVEGRHHYIANDGKTPMPLLPRIGTTFNSKPFYEHLHKVDTTATLRTLVEKGGAFYAPWEPYYDDMVNIVEIANQYAQFDPTHFKKTALQDKLEPALNSYAISSYVQLIVSKDTSDQNFDDKWNSFVQTYLNKGGAELIQEQKDLSK